MIHLQKGSRFLLERLHHRAQDEDLAFQDFLDGRMNLAANPAILFF